MAARRQLLLFALVAAVFVLSEAFPLRSVRLTDRFHSFHRTLRLIKRQSSNCMMDKMEANSTVFQGCISLFENGINPGHLNNDTLHNFCENNCSNLLVDVITRLKRDCGAAGNIPDVTQLGEFLSQSCKHGVKNTYCFEIWNGLFDPQGSSTSIQQSYTQCIQEFNPTTFVCPSGCKVDLPQAFQRIYSNASSIKKTYSCLSRTHLAESTEQVSFQTNEAVLVEQWVLTNVGCCYRVPIDYNQPESLSATYWEKCGFKEPTLCTT